MLPKTRKEDRSKTKRADTVMGVAWFDRKQWGRLREIAADPDQLEESYEEWLSLAEEAIRNFKAAGAVLEKVPVDTEELILWCNAEARPIDGAARTEFAGRKLRAGQQSR